MFRTLYSKLAATLLVLFCLLGLMFFLLMRSTFEVQEEAVSQHLHRELAARLASEFQPGQSADAATHAVFTTVMRLNPSVEAYRLDAEGRIVAHAAPSERVMATHVDLKPVEAFLRGSARLPLRGDDPRRPGRKAIFSAARLGGESDASGFLYVILAGEERAAIARQLTGGSVLRSTVWVMVAGLVFALLAGFVVLNLLTERLARLAASMDAFREAGFTERAPYLPLRPDGRGDEIDRLGEAYNEMAERIVQQLGELRAVDAARRDLIANVSHDLRTPLASLRGYLDTLILKQGTLTEAERRDYLETAARQSERLGALIADLFDLAKLDAHDVKLAAERFVLSELVQDVVQGVKLAATERGVEVKAAVPSDPVFVHGDIGLIERVLQNLLGNALRHTAAGGTVTAQVAVDDGAVRIEVADTGQGIAPDVLPKVFDRFYTLDKSRTSALGGTGLGLAIAKRIVELHGSTIEVESTVGIGTRFWFELPVPVSA